jgi:hypothetical protein
MRMWHDQAVNPQQVEYIFALNGDDPSAPQLLHLLGLESLQFARLHVVTDHFQGSAAAWDAAAKASMGDILIQAQDDVEPPKRWDESLEALLVNEDYNTPAFIGVSDGYRKVDLCCTAIMNRARYLQAGEFLHAGYLSVFSDDEVTIRAMADGQDGKSLFIKARDLVFRHEHAYHNLNVPIDDTYRKENSAEAYAKGAALFMKRNQTLIYRGLRTWS